MNPVPIMDVGNIDDVVYLFGEQITQDIDEPNTVLVLANCSASQVADLTIRVHSLVVFGGLFNAQGVNLNIQVQEGEFYNFSIILAASINRQPDHNQATTAVLQRLRNLGVPVEKDASGMLQLYIPPDVAEGLNIEYV